MYDFIICKKKLPIPEGFIKLDFSKEPFRTSSLFKSFNNYIISEDGRLYKQKNELLEEFKYNGFIYFSTHFFDEPHTKQYYISFFSSFDNGSLEELNLDGVKEYKLEDYKLDKFVKKNKKENLFLKASKFIKKLF